GRFFIPEADRVEDGRCQEHLLVATIEELLRHEVALREGTAGKRRCLIFPSQLVRDYPESPEPEGKAVVFTFEGPVRNVYAALVVRLSRSRLFRIDQMWKN